MRLLSQKEDPPQPYTPTGHDTELDLTGPLWLRIEQWIAYRWGPRSVEWIVEGPGDWLPPLAPYEVDKAERWNGSEYEETTLSSGPLGLLLGGGLYRVTCTVGSQEYPCGLVQEAARRMSDYLQEGRVLGLVASKGSTTVNNVVPTSGRFSHQYVAPPGSLQGEGVSGPGRDISEEFERPMNWQSRALFYSGAADLLRRLRRP